MRPYGRERSLTPHVLIEGWRWTTWEPWSMISHAYLVGGESDPHVLAERARLARRR
jgi:hypothetical protein